MAVYLYPEGGRAGLGNRLFPWARCELFARKTGLKIVAPVWVRPKIGPILRGERDFRFYAGLFGASDYISGLPRLALLALAKRARPESCDLRLTAAAGWPSLLVFEGLGRYFADVMAGRDYLVERFWRMVPPGHREALSALRPQEPTIMIHMRRGDFGEPVPYGKLSAEPYYALSDEWYVRCIASLRARYGDLPVSLVSDADERQLGEICSARNVRLVRGGNALVEMLLLSEAHVLVTSPGSTFSAWAAFLGDMPIVTVPSNLYPPFVEAGRTVLSCDAFAELG